MVVALTVTLFYQSTPTLFPCLSNKTRIAHTVCPFCFTMRPIGLLPLAVYCPVLLLSFLMISLTALKRSLLARCSVTRKWSLMLSVTALTASLITGCGFHLPNQTALDETMPQINVVGDYHSDFYKMVINRLRANGVEVYAQSSDFDPDLKQNIPSLMLPEPNVTNEVVSVNSLAQSIENSLLVSISATLTIPNHRPILMRNSITRSVLNKPGQSLTSNTEVNMVINETYEQLADELVLRLSYLGRSSDPDAAVPQPSELTYTPGEDDPSTLEQLKPQTSGMTLMEALQVQNQYEAQQQSTSVSYDELNNGQAILEPSITTPAATTTTTNHAGATGSTEQAVPQKSYQLPPVRPERLHRAPNGI